MADKQVNIKINVDGKDAEKGLRNVQTSLKDMSAHIQNFADNIKGRFVEIFGGLAASFATLKTAFDITKQAGEFREASELMFKQFGVKADEMISKVKAATNGMVSSAKIIEQTNKAMALGVTKDVGKITQIYQIAEVLGKTTGKSISESFDLITAAVGRGRPGMLAQVGISNELIKSWEKQAEATGGVMDSQTLLNNVIAVGTDKMSKMGGELPSISDRMDAMSASIDDAKISLGEALIPVFESIVPIIQTVISGFSRLPSGIKVVGVSMAALIPAVIALNAALGPVGLALTGVAVATALFIGASERARAEKAKLDEALSTKYDSALAQKSQKELLAWYKVVSASASDADVALARSIEKEWDRRKEAAEKNKQIAVEAVKAESEAIKKAREDYNKAYADLVTNNEKSTLQTRLDALNKLLQSEYAAGEERKAIEREIAKTKEDILEESYKKQLASVQQTISAISQIEQGFSSIFSGLSANRSQEMENEQILRTNAIQESLNQGLISEEEYATQKKAIDKDIAMKSAQQKRKDAEMNKGLKMFEIITSTASAIVNALATGGPPWLSIPLSVAIGALGAVQLGIAAAAPLPEIPAFAKGVANFIGGAALVGEQGPEIVNLPMGSSVVPNSGLSSFADTQNARAITADLLRAGSSDNRNQSSRTVNFNGVNVYSNDPQDFFQQMQQYLRENEGIA